MRKPFGKCLSLLLVVALLIQLLPTTIFATESETTADPNVTDDAMSGYADELESIENPASSVTILFEEESLREESVKHFRMDDGSYIAVQYGTPVHYEEDGKWVEYDNTLHEVSTLDGEGISHYTVTNGDSTRVFAADANAETLLYVQYGDYALSLSPVEDPNAEIPLVPTVPEMAMEMGEISHGESADTASIGTGATVEISTEELVPATILSVASDGGETFDDPVLADAQPDKIYSALEYADVISGADIRYENYANTIKESIIISEPQSEYVYSFVLATEGLTPSLQEDGSVLLISEDGSVPYRIPAPYMFDGNSEYSFDAYYTLEPVGNEWLFTVTADADWINAEERVFPVFLDPTVEETYTSESQLCGGFVRSGYPGTADTSNPDFYVGHNGNANGLTRTYLHVNELVTLPEGCEIYQATISLYHVLHSYRTSGADIEVGAYEITKAGSLNGKSSADAWQTWANNLTWNQTINGTTTIDSVVLDKQTLGSSTAGNYVSWDITTLAFKWYDSENYHANKGIALKVITDDDESTVGSRAAFRGAGNTNYTSGKPCMKILYRNTRGIEDKYTYQTLNVGRAGTSHISDYTLDNTHIVPLFSSSSNVMPFSVSLVYNTALTGKYFSGSYSDVNTQNYNNMLVGVGWKLSLQQTVKQLTVGGITYLVYTDGDGTDHYFYDSGNGYQDEDGLSLTITVSGTTYTMTNPYGDKWIFVNGYLTEETDAYGNALYYCYNDNAYSSTATAWKPTATGANKVTAVYRKIVGVSATEQLLKIEYDGYFVSKIIGECDYNSSSAIANRTVTLGMTDWSTSSAPYKMLTSLTLPDGTEMQYTYYPTDAKYNMRHRLYTVYDSEANYGIEFNYSYEKNVCRFYEYILNNGSPVYGAKYHAYKRAHSQTAYRYYGKDGLPYMDSDGHLVDGDTGDDLLTVKILDNVGRTVGSYTSNSDESEILGAGAATYTENSGTSKKNNRITSVASAGQQGINILQNGSAENGATKWVNANPTNAEHFIGNKSFLLGEIGLLQNVTLTEGETYTLSAYVKIPSDTTFSTNGGVWLAFLPMGSSVPLSSGEKINYTTDGIDKGWVRLTATYTPDANITCRATVMRYGLTAGNVYADCIQLEKGSAASTFNIIDNGSMEHNSSGTTLPSTNNHGWSSDSSAQVVSSELALFGNNVIQLKGAPNAVRLNQTVQIYLPGNTTFLLSGWAKANAKPDSAKLITETVKPFFSIMVHLHYSDGTTEPFFFAFDSYYDDWQYAQGIVEAKRDDSVTITYAVVTAAYDKNINSVLFDNFSFRVEPVYNYDYNDNGDPTSASGTGVGEESMIYTGVDLTKYTAPNGNVTNYTYNNQHDVTATATAGATASSVYDTSGNLTNSELMATGTSKKILTSSVMTDDRNNVKEIYNDVGNKTTYNYHNYYGYLNHVVDAKGTKTYYTYTPTNGRAEQSYINNVIAVKRSYEDDKLSQLERVAYNGSSSFKQYYTFDFNVWGQTTQMAVGNQTLASYVYEDINNGLPNTGGGNLSTMIYGNGDSVNYSYDEFDRAVRIDYNNGRYVTYTYDASGGLANASYGDNDTETAESIFEYDSLGRLVRSVQSGNGHVYQRTEHQYDEFSRLYIQRWTIDGKTRSEKYTYNDGEGKDGSLKQLKTGSGHKINYNYDNLKRLSNASLTNSDGQELFKTAYAYKTVSGNQTSTQVEYRNIRTTEGVLVTGYKYEYDEVGNIVEIRQSEGSRYLLYKYEYDTLNQLVKETHYDGTGDTESDITAVYTYTYDTAGNLRSETKKVGTATTSKSYTYSTGDWKDLLTAVGGTTISYDGAGNPTNYYNGVKTFSNLSWEQGKHLTGITTGSKTYSYSYDLDGIRTQKVVDGVTHSYITQNGKVVRESFPYGDTTIIMDFIYDESGRPFAVVYSKNGGSSYTTYFYATNLQGDIEGLFRVILNEDTGLYEQKWYGRYIYDAWGNVTVTNASGGTPNTTSLAVRNPLRYRGYYYDSETGFYYLQSRYYDPANHRFINADQPEYTTAAGVNLNATNLFVYCANNPVMNIDNGGAFWDTVFDVISIVVSVVDVVTNPQDVTAWIGLAGDVIDLIPFVTGVGETVRAVNIAGDVADAADDVYDAAKAVDRLDDVTDTVSATNKMDNFEFTVECCFVAGTLVHTENGLVPIEEIQEGDLVWAWDERTGDISLKLVEETFVRDSNELVCIFVNGEQIIATPDHPFYVPTQGWTNAGDLLAGDTLVLVNGEYVKIEYVQHESFIRPVPVYNFRVQDYHTYYVSESKILVHNSNCAMDTPSPKFNDDQQAVLELADEYKKGMNRQDAETLVEWAKEYGISNHGPMKHPNRSGIWSYTEHIKIKNYHIPVLDIK